MSSYSSANDCGYKDIGEFRFLDKNGKLTKSSVLSAFKPPFPCTYYLNTVIALIAIIFLSLWNYGILPGTKLGFFCKDPLFSHKYMGETVDPWILGVAICIIFYFTFIFVEYIRQDNFRSIFCLEFFLEFYFYIKQFHIGIIIALGVTELTKTIVGEHRPHFFDTCLPDKNFNCTEGEIILDFTCTNSAVSLLDIVGASRSFPSGHSSISWYTGLFILYIIQTRLPLFKSGTGLKLFLFATTITFSLVCSLTRITDRRHHWWDVLVGFIIAFLTAIYIIIETEKQGKILHKNLYENGNVK